jgi:hypothetical protein
MEVPVAVPLPPGLVTLPQLLLVMTAPPELNVGLYQS